MTRFYIFLLTLLAICSGKDAYADHLLGGEINYKFISASGNTQTYRVTLSFFADCSSNTIGGAYAALPTANPMVYVYKGNTEIAAARLQADINKSNVEITPVCPDEKNNTACTNINNPLPGIKLFVYSGEFTITGQDANWRFAFKGELSYTSAGITSAGRSFIIQNAQIMDPASGQATVMYLEATLNNTTGTNSSATFTSLPTPFFCLNKASSYSLGAVDDENDQLTFSLVPGKTITQGTQPVIIDVVYLSPFTAVTPLPTAAGNFNFSPVNGQMNFTPNQIRNCLVVNLVEEFRNGVRVGSSMREMTFVILDNCNNDAPASPVSSINNAEVPGGSSDNLLLSVCEGQLQPVSFDVDAVDPNGDNITVSFSDMQNGAVITVTNNGTDSPVVHFSWNAGDAAPGTYIFYITYTDDGCPLVTTKTVAYTITIAPHTYIFTGNATNACAGQQNGKVWATPEPGVNIDYNYRWEDTAGNTLRQVNSTNGDTLQNVAAGTYKVYIRNSVGCGKNLVLVVKELPLPEVRLPNDTTVCEGLPIAINVTEQNDVSYLWNTGDSTCCIRATTGGAYVLTATNLCGATSDTTVLTYTKCDYCLFVPNAFSPNGDGVNDRFRVLPTCLIDQYKIEIFNRWGQRVFSGYSAETSWDGTYKGQPAESGVYYYLITASPSDKMKGMIKEKGDLTLIR